MIEWKEYKIGEIVTLEYGKSLKDYRTKIGKYDVFGTNGKIGLTDSFLFDKPSIIIGRKGAYREVHLAKKPFFVIDTAFYTKNKTSNVDTQYLYRWFKNVDINQMDSGSAIPSTSRDEVYDLDITLPPLPEQRSIASVLSSLDDKIDLLHRQNATLEAMAETLFRQWFVEEAKEDWEEKKLGEIADIKAGGDKPKVYSETKNERCRIPIYSNGIVNEGLYGYTDSAKINTESITISARGTIGYVCLRQEPYVPIVRLISIIPNENFISSKYLYFWAKSQNISGTGTTQEQLTVPDFSRTTLILPPFKIMDLFTNYVNKFFNKIQFNQTQIHTLTTLRDTLLPKLMSGEVRVEM